VAPLLRKLADGLDSPPIRLRGRLASGGFLPAPDARQTIWPARAKVVDGQYELTLLPLASSGDSSGLTGANALLPLPANGLDPARLVEFIACD
jgi:molybdopterin molybdotransferase